MTQAIMIAATGSGRGKTTVVCALLGALKNRGLRTRAFKCGPDYIDPLFHRAILGAPSRNLDLVMADEATTRALFERERDADAIVVEGVMGLYDGADFRSDEGSSYHVARALGLPIALVVDAKGTGRSVLAVIKGFLAMDEDRRISGVILNRVSESTFRRLRPVIEEEAGTTVYGYYPENKEETLESRHLGLKLPGEVDDIRERAQRAAATAAATLELDAMLAAARTLPESVAEHDRATPVRARIAVARDDAFCFYYDDNLRMLRESGAELVFFSPIADARLPENVDGLLLGGGYPELHAKALSENRGMLASIRAGYDAGLPTLAECGGFMYLHDAIETPEGSRVKLVGAISGECRFTGRLARFGYVELKEKRPTFLKESAGAIRGHEFHYYDSDNNGEDCVAVKPTTGRSWDAAHVDATRWLGFAHLYYPSNPAFPRAFVDKCARWRKERNDGKLA